LYGLYHITYEEIRNYDVFCSPCDKSYPVTIQISDAFNFKKYPGKDIFTKRIKVDLPFTKSVSAIIKQPSLMDEILSLSTLTNRPGSTVDNITEILIIDSFQQDIPENTKPTIYNDRIDILDAYLSLPARDKRRIKEVYKHEFGQYTVELKMRCTCPKCGKTDEVDINLVDQFFRMVYTS